MNDRTRILRGGARALTGLLVVGAAATAVVLLSSVTLPEVTRAPQPIVVDTTQNASRSLVCSGSFSVLGADANRPTAAIPTGVPAVVLSGAATGSASLTRAEGGEGLPAVFSAPVAVPLGAAQIQSVATDTLRGTVATACAEPLNEQWVLGGGSTLGISTTLSLGNPGAVPATVQLSVYDENGVVDTTQSSGLLVAPGTEQTVSLNGFAPDRASLAVRVVSTGSPVTASFGVGHSTGIEPFAVSGVTRQLEPETQLVIPGLANVSDQKDVPTDSGEGDEFPVTVRALAPGGEAGVARVAALDAKGVRTELGEIELANSAIGELRVPFWPAGASAVVIDSEVPVLGAALGSATKGKAHDYEWFVPAPEIEAKEPIAAPVVIGGRLVIVNTGESDATVDVRSADGSGKPSTTKVSAGASVVVKAPVDAMVTSSEPVNLGVRVLNGGELAGYPILAPDPRDGELTVYTR